MRYIVRKSLIWVIGYIWMPSNVLCSYTYTLTDHDIENCKDDDGEVTRESVEQWLMTHSGDFSSIEDWSASLEVGNQTIAFDWADEGSEYKYADTLGEGEQR